MRVQSIGFDWEGEQQCIGPFILRGPRQQRPIRVTIATQ